MKVRPKRIIKETAQCFGDMYGASAVIDLYPNQIWYAEKNHAYYYVHRRGAIQLRLTPTAFKRIFEFVEKRADNEQRETD